MVTPGTHTKKPRAKRLTNLEKAQERHRLPEAVFAPSLPGADSDEENRCGNMDLYINEKPSPFEETSGTEIIVQEKIAHVRLPFRTCKL